MQNSVYGMFCLRAKKGKNTQTLLSLEITSAFRTKILKELSTEDYSEGPNKEILYEGADMWVFGKNIKQQEVYIKIKLGCPSAQVICISFHIAEHKMKYPLKTDKL